MLLNMYIYLCSPRCRFIFLVMIYFVYSSMFNMTFCTGEQTLVEELLQKRKVASQTVESLDSQIEAILNKDGVTIVHDNDLPGSPPSISAENSNPSDNYVGASFTLNGYWFEGPEGQKIFRTTEALGHASLNSLRESGDLPPGFLHELTYMIENLSPELRIKFERFKVDLILEPTNLGPTPLPKVVSTPESPRLGHLGGSLFREMWEPRPLNERIAHIPYDANSPQNRGMGGELLKNFWKQKT